MSQNQREQAETQTPDDELSLNDAEILKEPTAGGTIEDAATAIEQMKARERRRDGTYDTGGDDQSPGIDTRMNGNAPKELNKD